MVATSSSPARLSAGLAAAFVHQVELESPTEGQRLAMLEALSQRLHLGMDVHLETVSRLTTVRDPAGRPTGPGSGSRDQVLDQRAETRSWISTQMNKGLGLSEDLRVEDSVGLVLKTFLISGAAVEQQDQAVLQRPCPQRTAAVGVDLLGVSDVSLLLPRASFWGT